MWKRALDSTCLQGLYSPLKKQKKSHLKKKLILIFRKNPVNAQVLAPTSNGLFGTMDARKSLNLNESNFSPELDSKIIFHGLTDVDAPGEWVNQIKETYLSVADVNIIVADFSSLPLHNLARSSLPIFAARRFADFITFLSEEGGVDLNSFHVIARSYGAHVAGLSGRQLDGKLGRITALEPASKITIGNGNNAGTGISSMNFKLSKDCAAFVDVVHINGQRFFFHGPQFGLVSSMGHADVYPNIAEKGLGCPGENLNSRRYSCKLML